MRHRPRPSLETEGIDTPWKSSVPVHPIPNPAPASPKTRGGAGPVSGESAFTPSRDAIERRSRRWLWIGLSLLTILAVGAVGYMVYLPRLKPKPPRQRDAVETVAGAYLDALARDDNEAAGKLSTIEEPPGIGSRCGVSEAPGQAPRSEL